MSPSMMRRIVVVVIGIPTAFGLVYLGGWALVGVLALLGVVGTSEYYAMAEKGGAKPLVALGYVAALAIPVVGYLATPAGPGVDPVLAMFGFALWFIAVLGVGVFTRAPDQAPLPALAATVFGPIYTTGLLSLLLMLRHGAPELSRGAATALVFYPLAMTWVCDSFAMSGGSALGGPKLAPVVSPNKTWSGAASGLVGGVLVALVYGIFVLGRMGVTLNVLQMVTLGLVVGFLGQLGDLAESLLKRSVGTKDSGGFFPGHGGVLDRLDSLYWVIPISACLLYLFGVL